MTVLVIFGLVYLGVILGGLPFLQLDRTGIALLGAIAMIATEAVTVEQAARSIDLPTVLLLFAFMVVSAQMRLGGFYDWITVRLSALPVTPATLLGVLIAVVALLSAVFSNDSSAWPSLRCWWMLACAATSIRFRSCSASPAPPTLDRRQP